MELQTPHPVDTRRAAIVRALDQPIIDTLAAETFQEVLHMLALQTRLAIGAHQSAISYVPHGDFRAAVHTHSFSEKYAKYNSYDVMPTGQGIWGLVVQHKKAVCMTQAELVAHPLWKNFSGLMDQRGLEHPPMRGWLAVPVLRPSGEVLGVLQLSDKNDDAEFTAEDLNLLIRLANMISPTFELQLVNQQLQKRTEEFQAQRRAALNIAQDAEEARQRAERNEQALRRSEERARLIVNTSFNSFITMDEAGAIADWNHQAEVTFGWSRAEILGKSLAETIIPPRYREAHDRGLEHFLAAGEGPVLNRRIELTALRRDGREFPVELTIVPMLWEGAYLFHAFIHDITKRKRAEEKLRQTAAELARSNSELELFASVASHDLQEPLRMISSYVDLLAQRYKGQLDDKAERWIRVAVDGAVRMKRLINDLLEFSRVGTRGKALTATDAGASCAAAIANLQQAIQESDALVTHGPLPTVLADATQLTQVLQNLIGNALKFHGPQRPEVRVEAERQDGHWQFAVRDNGIGIDPQFAERIFVIFQRLHTRQEYPGTGIGLALCRKVIERHGGRIWVESQPGQGATFYFTLPY